MPQADANFMRQWFKHGLFLPNSADPGSLPFDNPTLTGRPSTKYEYKQTLNPDMKSPRDYPFVYNVNTDSTPFIVWDCLRVAEFTGQCHLNVMERYHAYVTHILQQSINIIKEKRLQVGIFLANCLDFPNYHLTLSMPKYDRIFTSNLQDLIGLSRILTTFKPLLNTDNKQSMIITQTLNWIMHTPGADVQNVPRVEIFRILGMCREDTGLSHKLSEDVNNHREYYNNTHWFLAYLRADIMGGGIGIPAMDHVPKLSEVTHFNGMRMRNFRKGLNKLVPFKYRVNARKITMLNGMDRNVEWCLPDNGK
ncbi:uncharacterized protein LOC110988607 isoform X1 [Acanthaster planci]|uniref:Uncharacterized protein LOC110988607 isoform X1 n=1 Tax=Acanthaster planci TaxID=133434 RepID=A0A8B7ZT43_ACAPL|nr:uncharacterized protein LOC110988607 isoform X1 [Acanthaster planci]XP_022107996.1 uncharacterized protein LOC110988607 isoform X1 [Acanthaster planci]